VAYLLRSACGPGAATLAAHPFKRTPDRINDALLGVTMEAPHRLVLAPDVLQPHKCSATLGGMSRGFATPLAPLAELKARPVAAGALLALVPEALNLLQGLLRRTR